jgi:hypothetical protein
MDHSTTIAGACASIGLALGTVVGSAAGPGGALVGGYMGAFIVGSVGVIATVVVGR